MLPIFARDVLEIGSTGYDLLSGALGLGMFAGSIFIGTRGDFARKGDALLWSLRVGSMIFLTFGISRWYGLSLSTVRRDRQGRSIGVLRV